jgi:ribosomal protein S20
MKARHNKKRNSAFVYEALLREATAALLKKDKERCDTIINLLRKHFKEGTSLKRDLDCQRSLYESRGIGEDLCQKVLREATISSRLIDAEGLFKQQSALIRDINTELEPAVFNTYVPNYKTLASISQLFSFRATPKEQVLLENEVLSYMTGEEPPPPNIGQVDTLVVKTFVKKFNTKYENTLLAEQQELLSYYISSFVDNALQLKVFLNEEVSRLKTELEEASSIEEIQSDPQMIEKTNQVIEKLNSLHGATLTDEVVITVLKTQKLVKEIHYDGSNS